MLAEPIRKRKKRRKGRNTNRSEKPFNPHPSHRHSSPKPEETEENVFTTEGQTPIQIVTAIGEILRKHQRFAGMRVKVCHRLIISCWIAQRDGTMMYLDETQYAALTTALQHETFKRRMESTQREYDEFTNPAAVKKRQHKFVLRGYVTSTPKKK